MEAYLILSLCLLSCASLMSMNEREIPSSLVLCACLSGFLFVDKISYEVILAVMFFCVFFEFITIRYFSRGVPSLRIPILIILILIYGVGQA